MANKRENFIIFAKDFFGDAIDAELSFVRDEEIVHKTKFTDGFSIISMPDQLEPGVYDVIAKREEGEYRINNLMIAMASHYFNHSRLHGDIKLQDGNLHPNTIINQHKINPMFFDHVRSIPSNSKQIFDDIIINSSNPDSLRWGGQIHLRNKLEISKGEAVVKSKLVSWGKLSIELPEERGVYNIGINKDKGVVVSSDPVDLRIGILRIEDTDFVRLEVQNTYHPIRRGNNLYVFTDFELTSSDVEMHMPSARGIFGVVQQGKIYDTARSSISTKEVKLRVHKNGPVLASDRLYVYATDNYFLLWEGPTLHVALPRWDQSYLKLDWKEGLTFISWGTNGHTRYHISRPYNSSYITFKNGNTPVLIEEPLEKLLRGHGQIAGNILSDWNSIHSSPTATIEWNGVPLSPTP